MHRLTTFTFALAATVAVSQICSAQQNQTDHSSSEKAMSLLADRVSEIDRQNRQIISMLDELTKLLVSSHPTPPGEPSPSVPTTLRFGSEPYRGDRAAHIALVEYSDFECPYCGKYEHETSDQLIDTYVQPGRVKVFYLDLPSPAHPRAIPAARAARCAGEQGKYWEMHDSLFAGQGALSDADLLQRARVLNLDTKAFDECFTSGRYTEELEKAVADAERMGVDGTPTFFIGTIDPGGETMTVAVRISGAHPYETFRSALDKVLALQNQQSVQAH